MKKVIIVMLFTLMLLGSLIPTALATEVNIGTYNETTRSGAINNRVLTLSDGSTIWVGIGSGTDKIRIIQRSNEGVSLYDSDYAFYAIMTEFCMLEDGDYVIIGVSQYQAGSGNYQLMSLFMRFNHVTQSIDNVRFEGLSQGGGNAVISSMGIFKVATDTYVMPLLYYGSYWGYNVLEIKKYTLAAISTHYTTNSGNPNCLYMGEAISYQDPDSINHIYFINSYGSSATTTPSVYKLKMYGGSEALELQWTAGSGNYIGSGENCIAEIGKGKTTIESLTYLYFTYSYTYLVSSAPKIAIRQAIIAYNGGMQYSNVADTCMRKYNAPTGFTSGQLVFSFGELSGGDKNILRINFPYYDGATEGYYKYTLSALSWANMDEVGFNSTSNSNELLYDENVPYYYEDSIYFRDDDNGVAVEINLTGTNCRFYYGLDSIEISYDITLTWTPTDSSSAMVKNRNYNMLFTGKINNVGHNGMIFSLYVDNIFNSNNTCGTLGQKYKTIIFTSLGEHHFDVILYHNGEEVDTGLFSFTVIESGSTGWETQGTALYTAMLNLLPLVICIMLPAYFGGSKGGLVGYALGGIVGVAVAVSSNLLPFYYVYLIGLMIVIAFVFVIRSSGSGGAEK